MPNVRDQVRQFVLKRFWTGCSRVSLATLIGEFPAADKDELLACLKELAADGYGKMDRGWMADDWALNASQ